MRLFKYPRSSSMMLQHLNT